MKRLAVIGTTIALTGCDPCVDTFTVTWSQASDSYLVEMVVDDAETQFNVDGDSVTNLEGDIKFEDIEEVTSTGFTLVGIPTHIEVTVIDSGEEIAHGSGDPPKQDPDVCENGTLDLGG